MLVFPWCKCLILVYLMSFPFGTISWPVPVVYFGLYFGNSNLCRILMCFMYRSSHPELFFKKGVLKICSKFTCEHPCWSVISIKLLCNFIKIALRHGCSPVNLLHIFRTPFSRNTSGWLLLHVLDIIYWHLDIIWFCCKNDCSDVFSNRNFEKSSKKGNTFNKCRSIKWHYYIETSDLTDVFNVPLKSK